MEEGAVAAVAGAKTELAVAEIPLGVVLLDGGWPNRLPELPVVEAGGLADFVGEDGAKSEDVDRVASDGSEVWAGFCPKVNGAVDACTVVLCFPSGEVLMSSTSLVTPKIGF